MIQYDIGVGIKSLTICERFPQILKDIPLEMVIIPVVIESILYLARFVVVLLQLNQLFIILVKFIRRIGVTVIHSFQMV
jgi:hypothetical protein